MEELLKQWQEELNCDIDLRGQLVKRLKEKNKAKRKTFNSLINKLEGIGKIELVLLLPGREGI